MVAMGAPDRSVGTICKNDENDESNRLDSSHVQPVGCLDVRSNCFFRY